MQKDRSLSTKKSIEEKIEKPNTFNSLRNKREQHSNERLQPFVNSNNNNLLRRNNLAPLGRESSSLKTQNNENMKRQQLRNLK